ncbi:MAG: methyl-accepting chemotaxis protein [Nitrospiria bacterium]
MLRHFREMTIQNKLISNAAISLASITAVGFLITRIISASDDTFTQAEKMLEVADSASRTATAIRQISEPVSTVLHDWNVLKAKERFALNLQAYQVQLQVFKNGLEKEGDPSLTPKIKILEEGAVRIAGLSEEVFVLADKKVTADGEGKMFAAQAAIEEASELLSEINKVDYEVLEAIERMEMTLRRKTTSLFAESHKTNTYFSYLSIGILIISVLLTSIVSLLVSRSVSRPVKMLQKAVEAVSHGDLTYKINIKSYGEIGRLVQSFSRMVVDQRQLVTEVKNSSQKIKAASDELTDSSLKMRENSEMTEKQVAAVSKASTTTNDNVRAVAVAADQMASTIDEISRNIQEESRITSEAVTLSEVSNATISKLDLSSQNIGEMVKVISSIAEQTNLLALNATIEAARAGEVGKGFAVVASEVKDLANRTGKATEEIKDTILKIQEDTRSAIVETEKFSKVIEEINTLSSTVSGAVEEQAVTTRDITRNMEEAASGTEQVVASNGKVAKTSKNMATGAEDVFKAAKDLSKMGEEFLVLVNRFQN